MSDLHALWEQLMTEDVAKGLGDVRLDPIEPTNLTSKIASLRAHVPPAYLPFATMDGAPLAVHVSPRRELLDSPVVYIGIGDRTPQFVCARFRDLPTGAFLWIGQYFQSPDRQTILRAAVATIARGIDGARPVPDSLWSLLGTAQYEPTWWNAGATTITQAAWTTPGVNHPYAALSSIDDDAAVAHDQLSAHVTTSTAAILHAELIAAARNAGRDALESSTWSVLRAEAWLGGQWVHRSAKFLPIDEGLIGFTVALEAAVARRGFLDDTPFATLGQRPDAYRGADNAAGLPHLLAVADSLREAGDHETALRQLRNAAFVALHGRGEYPASLCEQIAVACEALPLGNDAAVVARAYGATTLRDR